LTRLRKSKLAAAVLAAGTAVVSAVASGANEPDMALVPAGPALLGGGLKMGLPGLAIYEVDGFWIDRFEVTNADFGGFVAATGRAPAVFSDDDAFNGADLPVTGINWDDANAYCTWAGKRLPSELEWEKAARGPEGQIYPWGAEFNAVNAHLSGEAPVSIRAFEADTSPFGVRGMAGNVSEWVSDTRMAMAGICGAGHHGHGGAAAAMPMAPGETCAFIKGNNWSGRPHMTPASNRMWDYTDTIAEFVGFRCAKSME
jgi:formylglycine-generating enzyme required for sulfatase activity